MVRQEGTLCDKVIGSVKLIESRTDSQMGLDLNLSSSASLFRRFLKRFKRMLCVCSSQRMSKARAEGEAEAGMISGLVSYPVKEPWPLFWSS